MLNSSSEKRLSQVHPELSRRVRLAIAELEKQGIAVQVVQGLRTFEEQDALYAQGRTQPGKIVTNAKAGFSNHNFGLAVDLCPFLSDGKPYWTAPDSTWKAIGKAAEAHGLEWGGRWKSIVDKPHVQLQGLSVNDCRALYKQGGLPLVWERATKARAAVEGQSIQTEHKATPVPVATAPAQTVTVTSPAPVSQNVAPVVSYQLPVSSAPTAQPSKPLTVTIFRLLPLLASGSFGAPLVQALTQYKWPLITLGAGLLGFWLGWQFKRPHLEK